MGTDEVYELDGGEWSLSFQRMRRISAGDESPNPGVARIDAREIAPGAWRATVAVDPTESVWLCARAPARNATVVTARGSEIAGEEIASHGDGAKLVRILRWPGQSETGFGPGTALVVQIEAGIEVEVTVVEGAAPRATGKPEVYGGWRLP